jgi:hypothetical protein
LQASGDDEPAPEADHEEQGGEEKSFEHASLHQQHFPQQRRSP